MFKNKKILVIAAHPDDEILGCGGSINKWVKHYGSEAYALILAEGLTSRYGNRSDISGGEIKKLRDSSISAANIIGYNRVSFEDFPDNRMDGVNLLDIVHVVEKYIQDYKPDVVLTHHFGDLNIDHRITYQSVITACRPLVHPSVKSILCFETPSSTEWNFPYYKNTFSPNMFIDIAESLQTKLDALACYTSEMRPAPHPRSFESLEAISMRWGSVIGKSYAEPFEVVYHLDI